MTTLHDFHADALDGSATNLADYKGKVVLVVNTASKCGKAPQFAGLQSLYEELADDGLVVLGFPCSQFAGQEFSDAGDIGDFCTKNYGVTFPMFAKIDVNGRRAHPLYKWLKRSSDGFFGGRISWNFTKFLVDRDGKFVARFSPDVLPADLAGDVRAALAAPQASATR